MAKGKIPKPKQPMHFAQISVAAVEKLIKGAATPVPAQPSGLRRVQGK
jgi:hypothetical protein